MITLDHVTKVYGQKGSQRSHHNKALDNVSFTISDGELAFLVGPSGAGKTTVLRLLTREIVAEQGRVLIKGADVGRLARRRVPELRRLVAVIPQDFKLLENRNVFDNVAFALQVLGWPRREAKRRVADMLDLVGLAGTALKWPAELSGGERQRVAIARAVAGGPAALLADEPTGNLDPVSSVGIIRLLGKISGDGTTVLCSTHDRQIVDATRGHVVSLSGGQVTSDALDAGYSGVTSRDDASRDDASRDDAKGGCGASGQEDT